MKDPNPNTIGNPIVKIETIIPSWAKQYIEEIRELGHDGITYTYLVIKEDELGKVANVPKTFASYSKEGLISVSSNYPEQYRELGLAHEIREHNEHKGEKGCCLICLKSELQDLEKTELNKKEYVQFRLEFFNDLVSFYEGKSRDVGEDSLLENLVMSRDYLIEVLNTL